MIKAFIYHMKHIIVTYDIRRRNYKLHSQLDEAGCVSGGSREDDGHSDSSFGIFTEGRLSLGHFNWERCRYYNLLPFNEFYMLI